LSEGIDFKIPVIDFSRIHVFEFFFFESFWEDSLRLSPERRDEFQKERWNKDGADQKFSSRPHKFILRQSG
jgi:hypothetical protein